jgi:hypothetical protein
VTPLEEPLFQKGAPSLMRARPQIKALVRNPSAFSTLLAPGKSWDNVRSTTAPYTESRLTRSVASERVGFPVVEHLVSRARICKPFKKPRNRFSAFTLERAVSVSLEQGGKGYYYYLKCLLGLKDILHYFLRPHTGGALFYDIRYSKHDQLSSIKKIPAH